MPQYQVPQPRQLPPLLMLSGTRHWPATWAQGQLARRSTLPVLPATRGQRYPGAYGAGSAGKIIGDNINAPIATVDTVVDAIKAVTDNLPNSGALTSLATAAALATVDSNVDAILVDTAEIGGSRVDSVPWNASWDAEVQSECADALTRTIRRRKAELDSGFAGLQ